MEAFDTFIIKLLKLVGIKIVYTVHNVLPHGASEDKIQQYTTIYRLADRLIVHTEDSRREVIDKMKISPDNIKVIKHGHFLYLARHPLRKLDYMAAANSKDVILFFGAVLRYKGLETAVHAMNKIVLTHQKACFIVVGMIKEDRLAYLNLIDNLGLNTHVLIIDRYIPEEEIASVAAYSKMAVFPYLKIDQSGAAIAMASLGLPLIASNIGGLREIVQDGVNGYLVQPGDVNGFADAILTLLHDSKLRDAMGRASFQRMCTEFDWGDIADKTLDCYRETLTL